MSSLTLSLRLTEAARPGSSPKLVSSWKNEGGEPLALTFWWNRRLEVRDAHDVAVVPGPGPVLPCGSAENWTVLAPGQTHEHAETLECTQPAGRTEAIGWSFEALPAGTYRARLIFEAPPAHGFSQAAPHPQAFTGRVESNAVEFVIPAKPVGFLARLFGGGAR